MQNVLSTLLRAVRSYANATRGPVPAQRGTTAWLTPIPAYGTVFPPMVPQPPPSSASLPVPAETAGMIAPNGVNNLGKHAYAYCKLHDYNFRSFLLVVGCPCGRSPTTPNTTIAGGVFVCQHCVTGFSRRDSWKRHMFRGHCTRRKKAPAVDVLDAMLVS